MTNTSDQNGDEAEYVHELGPDELPSEAVYNVVAAVSDRPPLELEPLACAVDPDALDGLFAQSSGDPSDSQAEFECCGYRIVVTADAVRIHADDGEV